MRSPDIAALLDQAAAATRAAADFRDSFALVPGFRAQHEPGPHMVRCIALMTDLAVTGQVAFCEHLIEGGPQPGSWLHWAPTGILCGICLKTACDMHAGPDGARCDRCRLAVPHEQLTIDVHVCPAVFDDREEPFVVVPPVLLWVALCSACQAVEDAGESR